MGDKWAVLPGSQRPPFSGRIVGRPVGDLKTTLALKPGTTTQQKQQIAKSAQAFGLRYSLGVVDHMIHLTGSVTNLQHAFQVDPYLVADDRTTFRSHNGPTSIPTAFGADVVVDVMGLDARPFASPLYRLLPARLLDPLTFSGYMASQVKNIYRAFPGNAGAGRKVGILELGGCYQPSAMAWYWNRAHLSGSPNVRTSGGQNTNDMNSTIEVMLDVEIIASLVPLAQTTIYFGPNSYQGFYDVLAQAITDRCDAVSISWGTLEANCSPSYLAAWEQLAKAGSQVGVTITAASGDKGASGGPEFPADIPHILGCGGTTLDAPNGNYRSESVWGHGGWATGGGYSAHFSQPAYQTPVKIGTNPHRMIPDVASDADPNTGFLVRVDTATYIVGGTSAASPFWAALICRINKAIKKKLGFANPKIYGLSLPTMRPVTTGTCGPYSGRPIYSLCCGLGTPPVDFWKKF